MIVYVYLQNLIHQSYTYKAAPSDDRAKYGLVISACGIPCNIAKTNR